VFISNPRLKSGVIALKGKMALAMIIDLSGQKLKCLLQILGSK
jgi:hypothetical protein